jgi:hypothetical protein
MGCGCCAASPDRRDEARPRTSRRAGVEVSNEAAGRARSRVAAVGLLAQPMSPLLGGEGGEGLSRRQLVPLALASGCLPPSAEDRLHVIAAHLVGGHGMYWGFGCPHEQDSAGHHEDPLALRMATTSRLGGQPISSAVHNQRSCLFSSRTATAAQRAPRCRMTEISDTSVAGWATCTDRTDAR